MKKNTYKLIVFILFGFMFYSHAYALTVTPARIEINADPGQKLEGEFSLINEQEDTKTFYSSTANFEAQGESGTPTFTDSKEGLASWIHLQPEVTLNKGEQAKVAFSIQVPKDADAGGHFAAIFLSTVPNATDKGQVSIGAKIGVLVLLRVSGDVKEGGGILGLDTKNSSKIFTSLPINFVYRFNNSGGDRVNPLGDLVIKNTFGLTSAKLNANETKGNVLPGSTRRFDILWGGDSMPTNKSFFSMAGYELRHFAFGIYTAHLNLAYGDKGSTTEASKTVYVFPWQLLVLVLIVLIIAFFIFSKGIKRYNKWIISKAQITE